MEGAGGRGAAEGGGRRGWTERRGKGRRAALSPALYAAAPPAPSFVVANKRKETETERRTEKTPPRPTSLSLQRSAASARRRRRRDRARRSNMPQPVETSFAANGSLSALAPARMCANRGDEQGADFAARVIGPVRAQSAAGQRQRAKKRRCISSTAPPACSEAQSIIDVDDPGDYYFATHTRRTTPLAASASFSLPSSPSPPLALFSSGALSRSSLSFGSSLSLAGFRRAERPPSHPSGSRPGRPGPGHPKTTRAPPLSSRLERDDPRAPRDATTRTPLGPAHPRSSSATRRARSVLHL